MPTTPITTPRVTVTLNAQQQLYVLDTGEGYTCLGFKVAQENADQVAQRLGRKDLAFVVGDFGTLAGYQKYLAATKAWGESPKSKETYFDPGTIPKVAATLEACRKHQSEVRLILGDPDTGKVWLEEHDVLGRIGRSMGPTRVPLLVERGECGGGAILTSNLLGIVDWESGHWLYRHPKYTPPSLEAGKSGPDSHPWEVRRDGEVVARFETAGKAGAYIAFMHGETVEPRVFQGGER